VEQDKKQNKTELFLEKSGEWFYHTELLQHVPAWYYDELKEKLYNDPVYIDKRADFTLDDSTSTIVHQVCKFKLSEVEGLNEEQNMYYPICDREEIERIFDPQDADDYLLKLRADEVNDHPRIARVFFKLRQHYGEEWNFNDYFRSPLFGQYNFQLSPEMEAYCDNIQAGFINYPAVNGLCTKSPFGDVVLISYALKHFLFYMNLWAIGDFLRLSEQDRFEALMIGVRTMLGYESMDFEIDPCADLPEEMRQTVQDLTDLQLKFVIGHEFAHQYLGHLDGNKMIDFKSLGMMDGRIGSLQLYNYSQQHELEADYYAIKNLDTTNEIQESYLDAALTFFTILEIYEYFQEFISPHVGNFRTHPRPVDRLWELRSKFPETMCYTTADLTLILANSEELKRYLIDEFIDFNVDSIEMYGSNYIKSFKSKMPFDRLDN
jgi:hypothetical protein